MRPEERVAAERAGRLARAFVLGALALVLLAYPAAYMHARATLRLVHYSGGYIARPHAMHGLGLTLDEIVFAPAAWAEEIVRGTIDPTWRW